MSDSVWPHRRQPTRLPCPWDSPGKNTGVGCHFLLSWMKVKSESEVAQSGPTLSDPMDCSLPAPPSMGFFQARVLEWDTIASCLMQETRVKSLAGEDPLEKGMTTHSSIPAWKISWTEEPGRLQLVGSKELDTTERLTLSLSLIRFSERNTSLRMSASTQNQGLDIVDGKACSWVLSLIRLF